MNENTETTGNQDNTELIKNLQARLTQLENQLSHPAIPQEIEEEKAIIKRFLIKMKTNLNSGSLNSGCPKLEFLFL